MKAKRLLAFLLSLIIIFAGLPTIISSADGAYNVGRWYIDYNSSNYTKEHWVDFTVNNHGVLQFKGDRLTYNGAEQMLTFYIYDKTNMNSPIWSASKNNFEVSNDRYDRLVGLDVGNYRLVVRPSFYSYMFTNGQSVRFNFELNYVNIDNYELEPNNDKNSANRINYFDRPVCGYADNSEDYYSITVNKDTPVRIKVKNYAELIKSVFIKFMNAQNQTEFLSSYKAVAAKDHYYFDVMLKKGTNYINITSLSRGQIDYSFEISKNVTIPTPVIKNLKISGTKVEVSWNQLYGITGYEIWRKVNSGSWQLLLTPNNTTIGFWNSGINFKNTYQYKVRAFETVGGVKLYGSWSKIKALNPTPTNIKLSASAYTYNGKVKTPTVTIKDKTGKLLKKNTDYTVSYQSGRKAIGKYKVAITFKGNYSGKKNVYFNIVPKGTTLSKVTAAKKSLKVYLKKQTSQTSGYQVQYSTSKKFSGAKSVLIKSNKTTSTTLKSLKARTTYYVRVRTYKTVNGTKYYSSWSGYKYNKTK
ncbi:MAG: fibronectin type III domain-containing protein [Acutalibacteraceae bacterium]|nr:fibronectin type III domain-containing protein [Acutalibacteraceae bacterium]